MLTDREREGALAGLTGLPVVGCYYYVPCVFWPWLGRTERWWPVLGPRHNDIEFFEFGDEHYHVDPRFLTKCQRRTAERGSFYGGTRDRVLSKCQSAPISRLTTATEFEPGYTDPPTTPTMRRKLCTSTDTAFQFADKKPVAELRVAFSGRFCGGRPGAWVCPHRGAPLTGIEVHDGVLTCPLHGLRIDDATGEVLAPLRARGGEREERT